MMKQTLLTLTFLIALAISASAQGSSTAFRFRSGSSLPSTCRVGDVFYKTSATTGQYNCTAVNTWAIVGSAAGTVTTAGGTANSLPVWLTSTTLGDSGVADDGSQISFNRANLTFGTSDVTASFSNTPQTIGFLAGSTSLNIDGTAQIVSIVAGSGLILPTVTTGVWHGAVIDGLYGGTGVANSGKTITLGGNLVTSGAFATTLTVTGITGVTLPTTGTLATLAGLEELTNKTLNASVGKGTWTASGTWTLPAFTLGGTISGGGNQINNVIIGTSTPLAGSFTTLAASSTITQTSNSATAFSSGPNGATNPVLQIVNSTASQADGVSITGLAAGSGTTFTALSSGSNAGFTFINKGTGNLIVNGGNDTGLQLRNDGTQFTSFYLYNGSTKKAGFGYDNSSVQGYLATFTAGAVFSIYTNTGSTEGLRVGSTGIVSTVSTGGFGISASTTSATPPDLAFTRISAGLGGIGTGVAGSFAGDLALRNIKMGATTARGTTEGTNTLSLFNGTAPVGTLTNGASLYVSGGEMFTIDAGGTATQISSHDKDGYLIFNSHYTTTGRRVVIDAEKLLRFLNSHFGTDFVHEYLEVKR